MDPMTLALLGIGGAEAIKGIASGVARLDPLSDDQKAALKELERKEALGLLGLSSGEEQRLLNQQLQPVRASQRQAMTQAAQSQQVADIGQGAAFRQQAALQEAQGRATQQAAERAQQQVQQLEQLAIARDLARIEKLNKQKQANRMAVADIVGSVAGGLGKAADVGVFQQEQENFNKMLADAADKTAKQKIAQKNTGQKTKISSDFLSSLSMGDPNAGAGALQISLGSIDFSNRGQGQSLLAGSPLPPQEEIQKMSREELLRELERPQFEDLVSDNVKLSWADAQVVRNPRTQMVEKVFVTMPSGFVRTYTPGEDGWTDIMRDLESAGWGKGAL